MHQERMYNLRTMYKFCYFTVHAHIPAASGAGVVCFKWPIILN